MVERLFFTSSRNVLPGECCPSALNFFFSIPILSPTRAPTKQGCESIWRLKCIFSSAHFVKLAILPSLFLFSVFKKQQHTMNCLDDDFFFLFAAFKTRRFFIYSINKVLWWDCIWMEKFMFSLLSLFCLLFCVKKNNLRRADVSHFFLMDHKKTEIFAKFGVYFVLFHVFNIVCVVLHVHIFTS